jgi:ammonium transporter, Amt family
VPKLAESLDWGQGGLLYGGGLHQLGVQALGLVSVGAFTLTASFLILWVMKVTVGIRAEPEVEAAGLDVSEHGMWGYPEFYIPVPGGYGTEHHAHSAVTAQRHAPPAAEPAPAPAPG